MFNGFDSTMDDFDQGFDQGFESHHHGHNHHHGHSGFDSHHHGHNHHRHHGFDPDHHHDDTTIIINNTEYNGGRYRQYGTLGRSYYDNYQSPNPNAQMAIRIVSAIFAVIIFATFIGIIIYIMSHEPSRPHWA